MPWLGRELLSLRHALAAGASAPSSDNRSAAGAIMRLGSAWLAVLALGGCSAGGAPSAPVQGGAARAAANYPPMVLGGNVHATDGHERPLSCAAAGARVEQKGGPSFVFGGADPADPDLCRMTVGGEPVRAWYDIWLTDWPGAGQARPALRQVIEGPSGTIAGFDTVMGPGLHFHDLVRNEGVEDITLLGRSYHALKISHYREGFDDNGYRSVSTLWKDIPTGMLVYGTYQHIAGAPEIDDPLLPTAITPAR